MATLVSSSILTPSILSLPGPSKPNSLTTVNSVDPTAAATPAKKIPLPKTIFGAGPRPDGPLSKWKGVPFAELGMIQPEKEDSLLVKCGKADSFFGIALAQAFKEREEKYEGVTAPIDLGPCITCHAKQRDCRGGIPCRHCANTHGLDVGKIKCHYPPTPLNRNAPISGYVTFQTHPQQFQAPKKKAQPPKPEDRDRTKEMERKKGVTLASLKRTHDDMQSGKDKTNTENALPPNAPKPFVKPIRNDTGSRDNQIHKNNILGPSNAQPTASSSTGNDNPGAPKKRTRINKPKPPGEALTHENMKRLLSLDDKPESVNLGDLIGLVPGKKSLWYEPNSPAGWKEAKGRSLKSGYYDGFAERKLPSGSAEIPQIEMRRKEGVLVEQWMWRNGLRRGRAQAAPGTRKRAGQS